jgi:hypothetical protein
MASPYLVPVTALLRDVPSSMSVEFDAPFDEPREFEPRGAVETDVFPEATVHVKLRLESFSGGFACGGASRPPGTGSVGAVLPPYSG